MHLLRWREQCTCCGGVDNALAAVGGQCTCWGGVDNALAAVAWIWRGYGVEYSKIADTNLAE